MKECIRVAVFGNSFSTKVQLPALRWCGHNELVGIAGADLAKARATASAWGAPIGTDDWRALLDEAPDLIVVTTPVFLHHDMTLAALDAGCAVLCEKPFALNADEAVRMLARARGRAAWIDHQLRFGPHVRELHARIVAGQLGTPWHARFEMPLPPAGYAERPYRWWFDAKLGGGILGAIGSHMLDLLRFLWGDVVAIRCELGAFVSERADAGGTVHSVTADDWASLSVRFANGAIGELETALGIPSDESFRLQLTGSDAALRLVEGDELSLSVGGAAFEPVQVEPPLLASTDYGMEQDFGIFSRCQPLFMREVVNAVRRGDAFIEHAATFDDGLVNQRLLDAARVSAANGSGWVNVG